MKCFDAVWRAIRSRSTSSSRSRFSSSRSRRVQLRPVRIGKATEFLQLFSDRALKPLDFGAERASLKIRTQRLDVGSPTRGILADDGAALVALTNAGRFPEIDFAFETRAGKAACVSYERPADRFGASTIVMYVLLGLVRVVPVLVRFEPADLLVEFNGSELDLDDSLQGMHHRSCPEGVDTANARRSITQAHRIVIAVGEPKPHQQTACGLDAQRVDQFFSDKPHRRRTQNDHPLLVQADDPLVGTKVEQFG